jgi:hypothetical protein
MIILKIKDRGLYLEIPGLSPIRTPVEVDITKCNLSMISVYLRKQGITDYEIYSRSDITHEKTEINIDNVEENNIKDRSIEKRFSKLENMIGQILKNKRDEGTANSEQITNKLEKIEKLALKLLDKDPLIIQSDRAVKTIEKPKDPKIEELNDTFIPSIDTSKMKIRGSSSKTKATNNKMDLDDSVDLLSRIMGQED